MLKSSFIIHLHAPYDVRGNSFALVTLQYANPFRIRVKSDARATTHEAQYSGVQFAKVRLSAATHMRV